jgi:hypothetical protein
MQTFQDTETGEVWAYEPDVVVTQVDGVYAFASADGTPLSAPATLQPYDPPTGPTPAEQAQSLLAQKIAAGIAVTSTGSPGLSATFALDPTTMDQIGSVARDSASGLGLPGGGSTFMYPDLTATRHSLTGPQIIGLYKAQRDLLLALNTQAAIMAQGGSPVWPAQSAEIP